MLGRGQPDACLESCNYEGHTQDVHDAETNEQKRACIDALGWEPSVLGGK